MLFLLKFQKTICICRLAFFHFFHKVQTENNICRTSSEFEWLADNSQVNYWDFTRPNNIFMRYGGSNSSHKLIKCILIRKKNGTNPAIHMKLFTYMWSLEFPTLCFLLFSMESDRFVCNLTCEVSPDSSCKEL